MADEIKNIVNKVSEGLNFFDFSFFVSGFLTFIIIEYAVNVFNDRYIHFASFMDYVVAVVFIYISGIISFVSGRFLRTKVRDRLEVDVKPTKWYQVSTFKFIYTNTLIKYNALAIEGIPKTDPSLAYSQMWIEIHKNDNDGKSYRDLYRQWVMQAVCEGLLFSFLLALLFSLILPIYEWRMNDTIPHISIYVIGLCGSIIGILVCLREAQRYAENQIKEVIISYLLLKGKMSKEK